MGTEHAVAWNPQADGVVGYGVGNRPVGGGATDGVCYLAVGAGGACGNVL